MYNNGKKDCVREGRIFSNYPKDFVGGARLVSSYTVLDKTPRIAKSTKSNSSTDPCEVRSAPNKDGNTIRLEETGTVLYLKGAVQNTIGNTWYETEDGYFIYNQDLEILVSDAGYSETAISAIAISKNKDCYLKDKPYEASDHPGQSVARGNSVNLVAKVTNRHNNIWYKTADGRFIYSGDLNVFEATVLFPISAQFTNTVMRFSRKEPYESADSASLIQKNDQVTVKQFVVNKYGNIWAQLADGSFLCFYDQNADETRMKYVESSAAITTSNVQKPSGNMNVGQSFEMRGMLKTNVPILSVSAQVLNRPAMTDALTKVTVKPGMNLREFDVNKSVNGTNLNYSVKFSNLTKGYYTYRIAAQLGFSTTGRPSSSARRRPPSKVISPWAIPRRMKTSTATITRFSPFPRSSPTP